MNVKVGESNSGSLVTQSIIMHFMRDVRETVLVEFDMFY